LYSKKQIIKAVAISCVISLIVGVLATSAYWKVDGLLNEDVLQRAKKIVTQNYVDKLTDEQIDTMNDAALTAMVAALNDPYSYYFDMAAFDEFEENSKEEYVGIGISVVYDKDEKTLTVTAPTAGGPAEKAGILPQDIILGVDGLTLSKDGYDAIISHIKGGKEGEVVTLFVMRDGRESEFSVERRKISLDTISGKILNGNIAYIKISEFQHNSVEDFSAALDDVKAKGAKGLIIDLRSNPGGYADSVIKMTDMLLPKGTIAYLEDNKGNKEYFESDKECLDIPMVVLVNEGTASAAELMAGSLQAYEKAEIVGMKTYGKAVGQTPFMLTEETAIYLTSARYYTPKGECINKKGIMPDVEIDLPEELKVSLSTLSDDKDVQLQAAIETIMKKIK